MVSLNNENTLRHEGETRFVEIGEITGEENGGTRYRLIDLEIALGEKRR